MRTVCLFLVLFACATGRDPLALSADAVASEQSKAGTFAGTVILARGGKTLLERTYATDATIYDVASVGKMFTGVAMAQLAARGLVDLDAPVRRYVPEFPHEAVTVRHLLSHRSGVPDLPEELFRNPPATLSGYVPFFTAATLEFAPGADRSYSNAGFVLAGIVIERVTGRAYRDYVRDEVFARARMGGVASPGLPHGGARMTARDLVRFFDALRAGTLPMHSGLGFGELAFDTDRLVGHSGGDTGVSADAYTYWNSGYTIVVLSNLDPPASHDVALAMRKLVENKINARPSEEE